VSKTTPAGFRGFEFWLYDVCASILFAQMADVIAESPCSQRPEWLTALNRELRVHAVVGASFYVPFDAWCDGHEEEFIELLAEASRRLAGQGQISAADAAAWAVLDGKPIIWRRQAFEDTAPVVAFTEILTMIIRGQYPDPPAGHRWYLGQPGVSTIQMPVR
jgi:hypothetical protein